jgi:hypothetical protein
MSKRILEIAERAGIHFSNKRILNGGNEIAQFVTKSSVEYFAELVAQECARVIEEHAKLFPEADTTWRCAMIESAKVVKDNFRS